MQENKLFFYYIFRTALTIKTEIKTFFSFFKARNMNKEKIENKIDKDPKTITDRRDSTKKPRGGSKT
jgi:hypothetical protein